jgi:uncharacterized protein
MKIFMTGGSGFIGHHLAVALLEDGHQITAAGRSDRPTALSQRRSFTFLPADTTKPGNWQNRVAGHDIVINLAGKSIFTYWTKKVKEQIYNSRVLTTRNIAASLTGAGDTIFFSTSAPGYYGDRGEDVLTEDEPPGDDFLASVCRDWEGEALKAQTDRIRVVITRFGIVFDRNGGALASMIPAFKLFLGGRLGSGRQWFPWIHLQDLIAAYRFAIKNTEISGPANWCAPLPVRNIELTKTLAGKLNRPVMLPAPAFVLTTVLGGFGKALLCSQRTQPARLQKAGFHFMYGDLDSALERVLRG